MNSIGKFGNSCIMIGNKSNNVVLEDLHVILYYEKTHMIVLNNILAFTRLNNQQYFKKSNSFLKMIKFL